MSLYQGFATQRGFGANLVDIPDPSEKIRKRGLQALAYKKEELAYINKQADRVLKQFESNNALEAKQRASNFKDKQFYADTLAAAKWKNYETEIKDAQRAANEPSDLQQLLSITKQGAALYKEIDTRRKESIDRYADEIYRDYGIGQKQLNGLVNAEDTVISDNIKLNALIRELGIRGDVPRDVIERLRRSGGYLPVAIQKLSAIRFGQQLQARVAQRLSDPVTLPGVPEGTTFYSVKDVGLREQILNEIVRTELLNEDGTKKFSNKVLQMSGLIGTEGTVERVKANFHGVAAENDNRDAVESQHEERIKVIQSFIAPGINGGDPVGAAGIQKAIYYYAGGENASREALSESREMVVNALVDGLKNGDFVWSEIEDLGDLPIKQRGSKKEVAWKDLFKREWDAIQDAGKASAKDAADDFELRLESTKAEAREAEIEVDELLKSGNPTVETLAKLHGEFTSRGAPYQGVAQKVAKALTQGRTTANDTAGASALLARSKRGEYITDEMVNTWNFSVGVKQEVLAKVAEHNNLVPTQGDGGTQEQLEFRIEAELQHIIEQKSGWQKNQTHKDAKKAALEQASIYYKGFREQNMSHGEAYTKARDLITKDIRDADGDWSAVDIGNGLQGFKGFVANEKTKHSEVFLDHQKWGEELSANPGLIYTNTYVSDGDVEAFANKVNTGYTLELPQSTMLIQSLTRGKISAIDAMNAQVERVRNAEIAKTGSTNIQSLPQSYIKLYKKEEERIPEGLRRYLGDINPVGPNIAYTKSGYQPPNQEHYYKRIRPLVSVGNPNAIAGDDLVIKDSNDVLKVNITNASVRQVLQMMENGHFSAAGDGQWDYDRLLQAATEAGIPLESKFNTSTQEKLLDATIKNHGAQGFPHKEIDGDGMALIEEIKVNLNEEKISSNYWRSMGACNDKACAWLKQEGYYE